MLKINSHYLPCCWNEDRYRNWQRYWHWYRKWLRVHRHRCWEIYRNWKKSITCYLWELSQQKSIFMLVFNTWNRNDHFSLQKAVCLTTNCKLHWSCLNFFIMRWWLTHCSCIRDSFRQRWNSYDLCLFFDTNLWRSLCWFNRSRCTSGSSNRSCCLFDYTIWQRFKLNHRL